MGTQLGVREQGQSYKVTKQNENKTKHTAFGNRLLTFNKLLWRDKSWSLIARICKGAGGISMKQSTKTTF